MTGRLAPRWLVRPANSAVAQMPRALLAAIASAVLDVIILVALVEVASWPALPAAVIGYTAGGVLQYFLCLWWVFPHAPRDAALGVVLFAFLSLIGLGLTGCVIATLHDWLGLAYPVAKAAALGAAFLWNFTSRKLWVFRPPSVPESVT